MGLCWLNFGFACFIFFLWETVPMMINFIGVQCLSQQECKIVSSTLQITPHIVCHFQVTCLNKLVIDGAIRISDKGILHTDLPGVSTSYVSG
jgi:hypothetical protein